MKLLPIGRKVWLPIIASIIVSPVCLLLAFLSAGAGDGTYSLAKVFYPYTMLSTLMFGSIVTPFIVLAILQYLIYGIGLGVAIATGHGRLVAISLIMLHMLAVLSCFLFIGQNFS